jgi:hypothetical protein
MTWRDAHAVDQQFNIFEPICDAFEADGGCGHDLGLTGAYAIIRAWERLRTAEAAKAIMEIKDQ